MFPKALSVQAVRELRSIEATCCYSRRDRFGSPCLAVCAGERIGESILVCLVASIETGEVFLVGIM
jgi:hypothetical protein